MRWIGRIEPSRLASILGVLMFIGASLALAGQIHLARLALKRLDRAQRDHRKAQATEPAPSPLMMQRLEATLERWRESRDSAGELFFGPPTTEDPPAEVGWTDSAAAYFAITRYVTEMRDLAARHAVEVAPELWFGFADYRREAPPAESVKALWADRANLGKLLAKLVDARPSALKAVQREVTPQDRKGSGRRGRSRRDGFAVDPAWQPRLDAGLAGRAYRFVFVGDTTVLRTFVNSLAHVGQPWLVLSVDVRPASAESGDPTDDDEIWVTEWSSEYSVVVEVVERRAANPVPTKSA